VTEKNFKTGGMPVFLSLRKNEMLFGGERTFADSIGKLPAAQWIPAFAGMTVRNVVMIRGGIL